MQVNEIFTSLSGEADGFGMQGGLATFVRLQGCNLNCSWCDTERAQHFNKRKDQSVEEVASQCTNHHIIITGGEPLMQVVEVEQLIETLCPYGRKEHLVTIETNGAIPITIFTAHQRYETLRWVVDYKLGSSGMSRYMLPEVFNYLFELDVIKFVIADLQDYRQAKELVLKNQQWCAKKIFSPLTPGGYPKLLAKAIVEDKLEGVTLSLQLHKLLHLA